MKSFAKVATAAIVIGVLTGFVSVPAALADGYPAEWDSLDVAGLTNLANQYKDQGAAGVENSKLLAGYVAAKYTTDSAAGNVVWNDWLEMATVLGRYVPAATQTAMAQSLQQALTPNAATTAALECDKLIKVGSCLVQLTKRSDAGSVSTTWITGSDKYKSTTELQQIRLSYFLRATDDAGKAARERMIALVTEKYLPTDEKARAVHGDVWHEVARACARDMSAEAKAQWISRIQTAFVDKEMNGYEFRVAGQALRRLGVKDKSGFSIAWMSKHDSWKTWQARRVYALALDLAGGSEAAKTARAQVATHVAQSYLADPVKARSMGTVRWGLLVRALGPDMSSETRAAWVSKLRTAFATAEMPASDLGSLIGATSRLGDTDIPGFVASWVGGQNCWQSWDPKELCNLLGLVGESDSAKAVRLQIANQVTTRFLTDNATMKSVGCAQWLTFVRAFDEDMSAENRATWGTKLLAAFAPDADAVKALAPKDVFCLADAARSLGKRTEASSLALSWLSNNDNAAKAKAVPIQLIELAGICSNWEKTALSQRLAELEAAWTIREQGGPLSYWENKTIANAWWHAGDKTKAQAWAMKAYQKVVGTEPARAAADSSALLKVAKLLWTFELTGKGKGYEAYATALAGLVKQGKLSVDISPYNSYFLARPLGTPETRQTVKAELTDSEGQPRLAAAKVLAFAYHAGGEFASWQTILDGKIAAEGITADTKARWLMARAYAERTSSSPPSPLYGKKWLDQALATAQSAPVRLEVVKALVRRCQNARRPAIAVSMLESMKDQFSGAELAAIEAMQQKLQAEQANLVSVANASLAAQEIAHKKARLAYYRKRLVIYQNANDSEKVARLQAAIAKLEQELGY